jgi:hypothetical protein
LVPIVVDLLSGNADMESVPLLLPPVQAPLLPGLSLLLWAVAKPAYQSGDGGGIPAQKL